ncbi:MAG: AMP-binding protein, partial [Clostridiales bacterium]|nr:AMP-binding protein [Clostridiales bacterium]
MMDTVYSLFENVAKNHRDETAIIENSRTMTFGELLDLVDGIAEGFPKGTCNVGIVMRHRAEMIAVILAALKRGAAYIPAEPDFPTGRIHDMMSEAQVDFVLTDRAYAHKLKGFDVKLAECGACEKISISNSPDDAGMAKPEDPAYVLYTSGTTGRPKGVCVSNSNVCHYVRAFYDEFHPGPGDIMLQYSVCSFDIFVEEVFTSLLNGAALAIPSDDDMTGIRPLMNFIERHGVTMVSGFPYLLAEMNHLPQIPKTLRLLISGGDVLRGVYVDRLIKQAEVYNTYGPSETTVCASYYRCDGNVLEDGTYPIGHPVKDAKIVILGKNGNEVPIGETGEICITGGGVSLGYIGDHDEENRAFERLADGSSMYHSGDLGYILPDG